MKKSNIEKSNIEWLKHPVLGPGMTWNPLAMRCTPVSSGCAHCWHLRMADRHAANPVLGPSDGSVRRAYRGEGPPVLRPRELEAPLRRRRPTLIAVQLMGDLFHDQIDDGQLEAVFDVMRMEPKHIFVVLTKRPQRAAWWYTERLRRCGGSDGVRYPLPNVWWGVSIEDQATADERIPILLQVPAAVRWVSAEPLLGPIDLSQWIDWIGQTGYAATDISWLVAGAETGPGARPMDLDWARSLRDQCIEAGAAFFFKRDSDGSRELDGRRWEQWPCD